MNGLGAGWLNLIGSPVYEYLFNIIYDLESNRINRQTQRKDYLDIFMQRREILIYIIGKVDIFLGNKDFEKIFFSSYP